MDRSHHIRCGWYHRKLKRSPTPGLLEKFADDAVVVEFSLIDNIKLHDSRNGSALDLRHRDQTDAHIWLDPDNAMRLVDHLALQLSTIDEANRTGYESNAADFKQQLRSLVEEIKHSTKEIQGSQYVVYHDAFQYFEKAFDLGQAITISPRPQVQAGAKRLRDIKQRIPAEGLQCVFSDPQFKSLSLVTLADELQLRVVEADPIAASFEPGATLYIEWMGALADSFAECLSPQ